MEYWSWLLDMNSQTGKAGAFPYDGVLLQYYTKSGKAFDLKRYRACCININYVVFDIFMIKCSHDLVFKNDFQTIFINQALWDVSKIVWCIGAFLRHSFSSYSFNSCVKLSTSCRKDSTIGFAPSIRCYFLVCPLVTDALLVTDAHYLMKKMSL